MILQLFKIFFKSRFQFYVVLFYTMYSVHDIISMSKTYHDRQPTFSIYTQYKYIIHNILQPNVKQTIMVNVHGIMGCMDLS